MAKGVYYFNNGTKYDGEFIDDKMNGKGIFYWPDGSFVDQNWIEGVKID